MFKKIKSLFSRKNATDPVPPKPSWQEIVELMHDKSLSSYSDEIVKVIYSADNEKRAVFFKSEHGFYYYSIEQLIEFDDEEWAYIAREPDALPAMWTAPMQTSARSMFGTEQEAWNDFIISPEYKSDFNE